MLDDCFYSQIKSLRDLFDVLLEKGAQKVTEFEHMVILKAPFKPKVKFLNITDKRSLGRSNILFFQNISSFNTFLHHHIITNL